MPCNPDELRHVPLFELLDDDEVEVLAAQVEIKRFAPLERIFQAGDPADHGYVVMSGTLARYSAVRGFGNTIRQLFS